MEIARNHDVALTIVLSQFRHGNFTPSTLFASLRGRRDVAATNLLRLCRSERGGQDNLRHAVNCPGIFLGLINTLCIKVDLVIHIQQTDIL